VSPATRRVTLMRKLSFILCLFALPAVAAAQHSFSLPPIGAPLPPIGLRSHWQQKSPPPWERRQLPAWEKNRIPPWERGHVPSRLGDHQRIGDQRFQHFGPQVIYVWQPYPVEMQPQVVIVERPVTRVVEVEVPVRDVPFEPPPSTRAPEPPYVPTGDRTLYVIPGCYVGNVPPQNVKLPETCDLAKLTTFTPQ
jgi:hypothetical protein